MLTLSGWNCRYQWFTGAWGASLGYTGFRYNLLSIHIATSSEFIRHIAIELNQHVFPRLICSHLQNTTASRWQKKLSRLNSSKGRLQFSLSTVRNLRWEQCHSNSVSITEFTGESFTFLDWLARGAWDENYEGWCFREIKGPWQQNKSYTGLFLSSPHTWLFYSLGFKNKHIFRDILWEVPPYVPIYCWHPTELIWAFLFHKFSNFTPLPRRTHSSLTGMVFTQFHMMKMRKGKRKVRRKVRRKSKYVIVMSRSDYLKWTVS